MARRRRVELAAIASLDADVARARQRCEEQVQLARERLMQRQCAGGSVHDAYLECLRPFFEAEHGVEGSEWSVSSLQAFLGRYFVVYREKDAFASVCAALEADGATRSEGHGDATRLRFAIESFDMLKRALRRDTATRMAELDGSALEQPVDGLASQASGRERAREEEEVALPRLAIHGNRPRPSVASPAPRTEPGSSSSRASSISAVQVSHSSTSSVLFFEDDDDDNEYSVPTNSVVIPAEFSVEVVKKSQNWFGRWRTRHLYLRWNELEMRTKAGTASSRHGVARSFPSQPVMSTLAPVAIAPPTSTHSSAGSVKSKRYALQNLLGIKLIQLNESDPSRKHAIDIHFKQTAASGHGYTTKSLILGSEKGVDALKKVMMVMSTLALFRGLVAGEKAQQLQRYVQSGANVNAFSSVPSQRFPGPMSPLQLVVMQCYAKSDTQNEFAIMKMLQESKVDVRCLLHWHFARRVLLSAEPAARSEFSAMRMLLPSTESTPAPALHLPLTGFGSDEHGWSLLMYLSLLGDVDRVRLLLKRICSSARERDSVHRYMEHVNGHGDTALHIAIKASGYRRDHAIQCEEVALAMASFSKPDDPAASSSSSMFFMSDANGQAVMHLAIKSKMWRLVEFLLQHNLFDSCSRDDFGNNALHLVIKVGAPLNIFEQTVERFKPKARRSSAGEDLDSHDQTSQASPLLLSIQRRREDYVKVLLDAGAVVTAYSLSEATMVVPPAGSTSAHADDTLLPVAIRMGLTDTARRIWQCGGLKCLSTKSSMLALAVRFGMYRLAYDFDRALRQEEHIFKDETSWWLDLETGYSAPTLAAIAGQFELVALMVDAGGGALHLMQHKFSGEALLHVLVFSGIEHQQEELNIGRPTVRPSHSKSLSEGDLLNTARTLNAPEESWKTALACTVFRLRVIEELVSHSLLTLPDLGIVMTTFKCTASSFRIHRREFLHTRNHEANAAANRMGERSTLFRMVSASSQASSSRFLVLLIAIMQIKCAESYSRATVTDLIAGPYEQQEETPLFDALSQGHVPNALLLLHCLLPSVGDEDSEQVYDGYGYQWMEGAGTSLLHAACQRPTDHDALMVIDVLLRHGAYSGCWDLKGWCAIHIAIQFQCDERAIQLFKKYDQDLNVWSDALHPLRMQGDAVVVPITPLMVAMEHNNIAAFRELIRCGADCRMTIPTYRLGILQFAVRCTRLDRQMIEELMELTALQRSSTKDADGTSGTEAAQILIARLQEKDAPGKEHEQAAGRKSAATQLTRVPEEAGDNTPLRITLLGLQTPELSHWDDTRASLLSSPAWTLARSFHATPPRSPSASSLGGDSARRRQLTLNGPRQLRDIGPQRAPTPPPLRNPFLEDAALGFLLGEEKATLTLIAQEARNEAHDWLKKRSGQKKLLSEARAQLQATQSHRRTGSGTVIPTLPEAHTPVTDAQLLDTYKTLAAKQFIDKHVALAVADARMLIEKEKRFIFQETGVYPGDFLLSSKSRDNSVGSASSASAKTASGMHRSASINSSMMLLSSRSNELSDPGNDSTHGGTAWWSDHGEGICDQEGTLLPELSERDGTWLSTGSAGSVGHDQDGDKMIVNPLDCEAFVHVIEKRKSMH